MICNSERNAVGSWGFRFKYKTTTCFGSTVASWVTHNGATFRSAWRTTDFALLELKTPIYDNTITLLGWDRTTNVPTKGTAIHHPAGDVMKISKETG